MQRFILMVGLFWLCCTALQAQYASFRAAGYLGFAHSQGGESFYGGYGFGLDYEQVLNERGRVLGGIEFRAIQWGDQLAFHAVWQRWVVCIWWRSRNHGPMEIAQGIFCGIGRRGPLQQLPSFCGVQQHHSGVGSPTAGGLWL